MDKFDTYFGVEGILAILLLGGVVALAIMGREVPEAVLHMSYAVVGFFFGGRAPSALKSITNGSSVKG
jgi:hypothetical protein